MPEDSRAGGSQLLLSVGVQPTLVPACPEPCVLPWAAPGGRAGCGMGCSAAWAALCPLGLPCGTRQYSLHRFCGCEQAGEPHVMPWGHGMLRPNLLGEGAGAGLCRLPLAGSEVAVADKCCSPSTFESKCLYWWLLEKLVGLVGNRGDVPA